MEKEKKFTRVEDLEVYRLARELSQIAWKVYEGLDWQNKKIMGEQFIRSTDSVGANIAEGYSRYHFLEKIKFFYIARGSLTECGTHWIELLKERSKVDEDQCRIFKAIAQKLEIKLNNFIAAIYKTKTDNRP
jgi:four helix bundle protein